MAIHIGYVNKDLIETLALKVVKNGGCNGKKNGLKYKKHLMKLATRFHTTSEKQVL